MTGRSREIRVHGSLLAAAEKRLLVRVAHRLPTKVSSDGLTALGATAMAGAGLCYALGPAWPGALLLAVLFLALNWAGDSLDGTVARVRRQERPRYGFYVDHVLDAAGVLALAGGLVAGGYLSPLSGAAFLVAYYLLMIEIALATHALGTFRMAYWRIGPTELRLLLAAGTFQLLRSPVVILAGHELLLFDVAAGAAAAGLVVTFAAAAVDHTRTLFRLEPLPPAARGVPSDRALPVAAPAVDRT